MTNPEVALLMLSLFIVMILLGFPVAFTLLAMGVGFGYYAYYQPGTIEVFADVFNNNIFYLLNQNTYSVMENDTLVAIPLFLFMGYVVERANIVNKLFYSLQMAARNLPGSMAVAALITCAVFSTASGIVGAVVTLMGLLAFPAMAQANYNKSFASGVICAGGTLGILIPPSIMLIVYAAIAELSPLRLYAAAIIPWVSPGGFVYRLRHCPASWSIRPVAPKPRDEDVPPRRVVYFQLLTSFVPLTVLIMLVLGSILGGLATPAEAAAMGAFGGLVLAALYRSLNWVMLKESVYLTAKATAMVCWLFVGSWTFASVFSYLGGHEIIEHFVLGFDLEPWQFLVMVQIIIFLLGWPLEWSEILIIFVPIFLPMLDNFGVNPYFFAMLVALNLQTSFLTPAHGHVRLLSEGGVGKSDRIGGYFQRHHALSRHRHFYYGLDVSVPSDRAVAAGFLFWQIYFLRPDEMGYHLNENRIGFGE